MVGFDFDVTSAVKYALRSKHFMKQLLLKLSVALAPRGKVCEDDFREPGLVVYTDNKRTIEPNMTIGVQPDDSLAEYIAKIQRTGIRKSVKGSESCH